MLDDVEDAVVLEETLPAPGLPWNPEVRGPQMSYPQGLTIFKYQMPILEKFSMNLPEGAVILRVDDVGGLFWMWAVVNVKSPLVSRNFRAFKTGADIPLGIRLNYIGYCKIFVQMELGLYIFEELGTVQ